MQSVDYARLDERPGDRALPDKPPNVSRFVGWWINTDRGTSGGILRLAITERNRTLLVRAYGAGAPKPYDWGEARATPLAPDVTGGPAWAFHAHFDFGFLGTLLSAYYRTGVLSVTSYNTFLDGSGRADYWTREFFYREGVR
ncbi:MAG: hypothetical protein ACRDPT_15840 [Streptomycetales bacterium]